MEGVRLFAPIALRGVMAQCAGRLQAAAGRPVLVTLDLTPAIRARLAGGEPFDLGIANPDHVRDLAAMGRIDGESAVPFGRIPLAIGCRADRAQPVRTDAEAIGALLRSADSIGYTGAGTSGRTYLETIARLGLPPDVEAKSRALTAGGPVAAALAGEVALAVVPLTTVLSSPGIAPVAIFPERLGSHIDLVAFLGRRPSAGSAFVHDMLLGPALDAELAAAGVFRAPGP